jgi:Ni,Fe-hydrogenase III component G
MLENVINLNKDQLLSAVQKMRYEGHRFVTCTCIDNGDGTLDVYYQFDKDYSMTNYLIKVSHEVEIPSISKIFFCAGLVENEMKELFGLNITNIVIDYGGHLLLSEGAPDRPMGRQITIVKKGE